MTVNQHKLQARLAAPIPFVHFLARKEPRWTLFGVIEPALLKNILVKHKKSGRELILDGTDMAPNQVQLPNLTALI